MIDKQDVAIAIEQLIAYAQDTLSLDCADAIYSRNSLMDTLAITNPYSDDVPTVTNIQDVIDLMVGYAQENNLYDAEDPIRYETRLFGLVTPAPSIINSEFKEIADNTSTEFACNWLFNLCQANNYLRMADINKNIMWEHVGSYGDIVVTINLSKPEKDPKQIAEALKAKTGYPACMLCTSNVGFNGNAAHPARQTLRMIPLEINNESWFVQFSPYQYYYQHLIALCNEHRPMKVDKNCLVRLTDFVEQYPHYFMGSNAALPIVGGSILTHDHYQGGGKVLPMFKSPLRNEYKSHYKGVEIFTVDWYNSVIRVSGKHKLNVVDAAADVLNKWQNYTDESVGIYCKTDAQHNAVTPIARFEDGHYIIDMILRNNRTDKAHPFGIYHPTEDLHNIKKEGIGIIEVMGIFILPGRLDKELQSVADYLNGSSVFNYEEVKAESHPLKNHADMINHLVNEFGTHNTSDLANRIIKDYINKACERILECTAVFKNTEEGMTAFDRFMTIGLDCNIK